MNGQPGSVSQGGGACRARGATDHGDEGSGVWIGNGVSHDVVDESIKQNTAAVVSVNGQVGCGSRVYGDEDRCDNRGSGGRGWTGNAAASTKMAVLVLK